MFKCLNNKTSNFYEYMYLLLFLWYFIFQVKGLRSLKTDDNKKDVLQKNSIVIKTSMTNCDVDFGKMNPFQIMFFFTSLGKFLEGGNSLTCGLEAFNSLKSYYIFNKGWCYIPSGSASVNFNLKFPYIYHKVKNPLLMFRIVAESQILSYDYYSSSINYNSDIREPTNMDFNYKSTLFEEWNNIKPDFMKITIKNIIGVEVAWLKFNVLEIDDRFSWFQQSRLNASYPWNVNLLKAGTYNYFSIFGATITTIQRRFYMSRWFGGCPNDFGALVVLDYKDVCNYLPDLNINFKSPKILYTVNNQNSANTTNFSKYGKYFEIWATYNFNILFMA